MAEGDGFRCPGQNTMFWKPTDIYDLTCPECGSQVEFWKDDARRRCPECDHQFYNPKLDLGCAEWCKYADKCVPDLVKNMDRAQLYKKRLLESVEFSLRKDPEAYRNAQRAAGLAEDASKQARITPKGPLTAAALYFLIKSEGERSKPPFHEAKKIMRILHTEEDVEKGVIRIIKGLLGGRNMDNTAYRIVSDAVSQAGAG